ncbi:Oxo-4-hydroxy-4-carboxy-5-ureidoimidazoline decarboxylase [Chytriomyces cf. hyalinus JEL632]|nr:Oxo-4-hydroxy-4-carboxy-5-ureidoimidazoline decarboxylase [Chytriomyces cf. hyalinus JEL632]
MGDINTASKHEFVSTINKLFEAAPPLAEYLYSHRPYESLAALIDVAQAAVLSKPPLFNDQQMLEIINAHPRLGAPKETLSEPSRREQGGASDGGVSATIDVDSSQQQVDAILARINREYEEKFGFKLVEFVNGRSKAGLVPVLQKRLDSGEVESEMATALTAMMDIARDRLRKSIK